MRRISRRELLGLGAAAGVVAASGASAGAAPERGGTLRLGLAGRGICAFDGRRPFDPVMRVLGHGAVFDCLTEIAADGSVVGELAERWDASPDARIWTIRLRQDALFHDGRPFTADDAVATLQLHMSAGRAAASALARNLAQVRKVSTHVIQIRLTSGDPGLPILLADPQLIILPAARMADAMRDGTGTGLYRLEPGLTGDRAVLRRVERHYKDGRAGWFDRIELLRVPNPSDRIEALRMGRVDAIGAIDPARVASLTRLGRFGVAETRGTAHVELSLTGASDDEARALLGHLGEALGVAAPAMPDRSARPAARTVAIDAPADRVPGFVALSNRLAAALHDAGLRIRDGAPLRLVARLRPGRPTEDWARAVRSAADRPALRVPVPGLVAHTARLAHGAHLGPHWDMDSARIAERWWFA